MKCKTIVVHPFSATPDREKECGRKTTFGSFCDNHQPEGNSLLKDVFPKVGPQGVSFGNFWVSHEIITGLPAESIEAGNQPYWSWVLIAQRVEKQIVENDALKKTILEALKDLEKLKKAIKKF